MVTRLSSAVFVCTLLAAACGTRGLPPFGRWVVSSESVELTPIVLTAEAATATQVLCVEIDGTFSEGGPPASGLHIDLEAEVTLDGSDPATVVIEVTDGDRMIDHRVGRPRSRWVQRFELDVPTDTEKPLHIAHRAHWFPKTPYVTASVRTEWVQATGGKVSVAYRASSTMSGDGHGESFDPPSGARVRTRIVDDERQCGTPKPPPIAGAIDLGVPPTSTSGGRRVLEKPP